MKNFESYLSAFVSASSQGDGIVIEVKNISNEELRVSFPNPYTGIRLYAESGEQVPIGRTILCWEESDPIVELCPGGSTSALVSLSPFWFDLHEVFLAKCSLNVSFCNGESEAVVVEGHVKLDLPSPRLNRVRNSATIPMIGSKISNVSRFVSIIKGGQ
ncbi:hypothetical protein V5E97_18195 [Singulisphaera sp. Ch08]|uniref:Gp5/Type VI secretion system Vgr protein OB-fold domain-containing protein n=1 Tax=Singulisphaera sp. Ch08 TaxID=3120278 RepID=A0AAU7CRX0_9BACT